MQKVKWVTQMIIDACLDLYGHNNKVSNIQSKNYRTTII